MRGYVIMPASSNPPNTDNPRQNPSSGPAPSVAVPEPPERPGEDNGNEDSPLQVVLAKGTFLKFAITIGSTVILGVSAVLAFYWSHHYRVTAHMENRTIHLTSGERAKLETKAEAQKNRAKLVKEVKREVEYAHRKIKLEQSEEIQKGMKKLTTKLTQAQKSEFRKILQEVKQTRKAVGRLPAGAGRISP